MKALGRHLLLELKGCDPVMLNDPSFLKKVLLGAAAECGAHVLSETFHQFCPQGVSGVIAIAESHIFIHTWPEYNYAAADIFTCGDTVQPEKAAEFLIDRLAPRNHSIMEMQRGILYKERII